MECSGCTWTPSATWAATLVIIGPTAEISTFISWSWRRGPVRRQQGHLVELAVVVEPLLAIEGSPGRLDRLDIVPHPGRRSIEVSAVAALNVRLDLGTQTKPEATPGVGGDLVRHRSREHRATRKRHGDTGCEEQARRRHRGGGNLHPGNLGGLGVEHAAEARTLELASEVGGVLPRTGTGHQVDLHSATLAKASHGPQHQNQVCVHSARPGRKELECR